ncbi:head morphogenesis protein, partial [Pantoea ananatis]
MDALERYSEIIDGWANQVATGFAASIAWHSEREWRENSQQIGAELRHVINNTPTGQVMRSIVTEQVKYIKSLPLEAAGRIYDIQNRAIETMAAGGRADAFAKEIAASGDVAASRAKLIARTEVGRAVTALTQARALASGSQG